MAEKNKGGRPTLPPEERGIQLSIRLHPEILLAVEAYAIKHSISRNAALNRLLGEWMRSEADQPADPGQVPW